MSFLLLVKMYNQNQLCGALSLQHVKAAMVPPNNRLDRKPEGSLLVLRESFQLHSVVVFLVSLPYKGFQPPARASGLLNPTPSKEGF